MTLEDYLKERNLTREKFAEKVGVSRQSIQALLRGGRPRIRLAFAIEKATDGMVKAETWVRR